MLSPSRSPGAQRRTTQPNRKLAPVPDVSTTPIPPIRREILVDASPELAFDVFTNGIGSWWPLAELAVHGNGTVEFIDGQIVETAANGDRAVWGRVSEWQPPSLLRFSWHPGRNPDRASRVTVTFESAGDQTLVRLEHDGWHVFDDPGMARDEYDEGWPMVIGRYGSALAKGVEQAGAAEVGGEE
jgi:uncharacterized protein YndB with AHSA1/START domain